MEIAKNIVLVLQVISSVLLILVVLFQSGKEAGLSSAISGGNNASYLGKGRGKTLDAKLAGATKWLSAAFVVLTIASLALIRLATNA